MVVVILVEVNGPVTPEIKAIDRFCENRTKENWEGEYTFVHHSEIQTIGIAGYTTLYIGPYRLAKDTEQRAVIDAFLVNDKQEVKVIYEGQPNRRGVTPRLEGIDVFPSKKNAEVIIRWRHPGQGGLRTVQKFLYGSKTFKLIDASNFGGRHSPIWAKAEIE